MKCFSNQKGSILVFFALLMPMLLMFVGFGYDTSRLYMEKGRVQNMADAAALAGVGAMKDEYGGSCRLVLKVPDGESFPDSNAMAQYADPEADKYLKLNSGNRVSLFEERSDVKTATEIKTQIDADGKEHYYYIVDVSVLEPVYFMKIVGAQPTWVGAQAIAEFIKASAPGKDWYHMLRSELALIPDPERIAKDQESLLNIARLFMGKTNDQMLDIFMPNGTNFNRNYLKGGHELIFMNYTDVANDDTCIATTIKDNDTRSPQTINWTRGDYGVYNEALQTIPLDTYDPEMGHFANMRFFFSEWMLATRPNVDKNRRSIRISFKFNDAGIITEARCRINRNKEYNYALDVTVKDNGYEGQTEPGKTGIYIGDKF